MDGGSGRDEATDRSQAAGACPTTASDRTSVARAVDACQGKDLEARMPQRLTDMITCARKRSAGIGVDPSVARLYG
jgi:hypothetical protein